ncbi:MAG: PAS domain S-box protein [Alphaproteobacteria bacterium]
MRYKVLRELRCRKVQAYLLVGVVLCVGYWFVRGSTWQSSTHFHTLLEVIATLLALMVGVSALVRYHSVKDNTILFIGTGFFGTALLDGFHAIVTSSHFKPMMPTDFPHLIPWSWVASRLFLSVLLCLSWYAWRRGVRLGKPGEISARGIYITTGILTLISFAFFILAPLPRAYYPEFIFHRPEEFVPAFFFGLALVGYLRKGAWRTDPLEHWLVLSLIVGFLGQAVFMSFSGRLFDLEFDLAHNLKSVSYVFVLTGLMMSMFAKFREVEASADKVAQVNAELKDEIEVRIRTEAKLIRAEEHTNMILTTLSDAVITIDKKGMITSINPAGVALFGYDPIELAGCNISMLMPEDDAAGHDQHIAEHVDTGKPKVIGKGRELFGRRKDGSLFPMELSVSEIRSAGEGYTGIMRDISKRKKAEEALSLLQSRMTDAIESIPDGFAIYDADDRLVMSNQNLRKINPGLSGIHVPGRTYEEILGDIARSGIVVDAIGNEDEWIEERMRQHRGELGQAYDFKAANGRWIRASDRPTKEGGTVSLRTDFTEIKRRELALERSNDEFEQFAGAISHDLQGSLLKIRASSDGLAQKFGGTIPKEGKAYISHLQEESAHVQNLIGDFLDLAHVTSDANPFERVDLEKIVRSVAGEFAAEINQTGGRVNIGPLPTLMADPDQMHHLFRHLIGNALKFHRQGEAPVVDVGFVDANNARTLGDAGLTGECEIVVGDNGIGFDDKDGERIFGAFRRLHDRAEFAGTGIGLAICRRIVQRHHGTIEADSRSGRGAKFRIRLPLAQKTEASLGADA